MSFAARIRYIITPYPCGPKLLVCRVQRFRRVVVCHSWLKHMESDVDICLWTEPTCSNRPHPRLNSFTCPSSTVNNLTHLTKVVGSMVSAPPLPLLLRLLLRLMPFRLALTPSCPNHLTYPRPLLFLQMAIEQRKHPMVQSMTPLDIHSRNRFPPVSTAPLATRASPHRLRAFPRMLLAASPNARNSNTPLPPPVPDTLLHPTLSSPSPRTSSTMWSAIPHLFQTLSASRKASELSLGPLWALG